MVSITLCGLDPLALLSDGIMPTILQWGWGLLIYAGVGGVFGRDADQEQLRTDWALGYQQFHFAQSPQLNRDLLQPSLGKLDVHRHIKSTACSTTSQVGACLG